MVVIQKGDELLLSYSQRVVTIAQVGREGWAIIGELTRVAAVR